jgi:tRNA A-37 threonylcarbamoyl transferase component Bud32
MKLPVLTLRMLGHSRDLPSLPCGLCLDDVAEGADIPQHFVLQRALRWLPGRRLVAEGTVAGQSVLVKCFFGRRSQTALWRELRGLRALLAAGLPAPGERLAYHMPQGGVLVTDWLASARPLDLSRVEEQVAAVELLADLHAAGLSHADPHPGNFLLPAGTAQAVPIDVGAIAPRGCWSRGGRERGEWRELARLIVQCPMDALVSDTDRLAAPSEAVERLVTTYCRRRGDAVRAPAASDWQGFMDAARRSRVRRYLRKTLRSTTEFEQRDRPDARVFVLRSALSPALEAVIADPAAAMASGEPLKAGRSATVVRPKGAPGWVIKRYNRRNLLQSWRRRLAPRARAAWRNGHHLALLGIPTARPLALIEASKGAGAGTPYLVLEDHGDCAIDRHARTAGVSERLATRVSRLLLGLRRADIAHRDTKASNLLVTAEEQVVLIDLDGMRSRRGGDSADATRFLANWTRAGDQPVHARFEAALRRVGLVS